MLLAVLGLTACQFRYLDTPSAPSETAAFEPLIPTPESAVFPLADHFEANLYPVKPVPLPEPYTPRWRAGIGVSFFSPLSFDWPQSRPGWFLTWSINIGENEVGAYESAQTVHMDPPPGVELGMEFVPLVGMLRGNLHYSEQLLTELAALNPGRTWLIGNEPDVLWQSNSSPQEYAQAFHRAAVAIRGGDPSAQLAMGGLSQITPLRLAYLDQMWDAYLEEFGAPPQVDVWTMHAFVLREEAGSWGVGIPPGLGDIASGTLWEVDDHDDLRLIEGQIRSMRSWMAEHGQRQKPLWITEYGILMPAEFGFTTAVVRNFMLDSFDLFSTLRDPNLGYAADDDLLVQRWVWFSTYYEPYPTGNAFFADGKPTPLMEAYGAWLDAQAAD